MVQSERIEAHSQILAARSEVFGRQLSIGMRESISKERGSNKYPPFFNYEGI